jgi:hypothetical protein
MPYALPMRYAFTVLLLTMAAPALATADPPPVPSLKAFDRLLGRCFVAGVGSGASDTHCFEPVFGGAHVRDRHVVLIDGKAVYRGETIYSRSGPEIVFTYFNSLGGVGQGKAKEAGGGIDFTGSMRAGPAGNPQPKDSKWRWQTGGGYEVSDGAGKPVLFRPVAAKRK